MMRNLLPILLALSAASGGGGVEGAAGQDPTGLPGVPDGWRLDLVAEAPAVQHPTVVCCAPDGRVFVGEDPMDMKPPARRAGGRVLCLHPDGRRTVFAENLYAPFGLFYLDGKLYVHHSPRLSVFRDENGVGKDRVDLFEQTNPEPWALDWNDHVPANFRLGMDGFLYMAVGDKGLFGAVGKDGSRADFRGGGILRFRPDGTRLEVFSTGTRNTLDVAIDDEDEIFTYDNTDEQHWMSRLTHMVDGGFYGYPWDFVPRRPYTLWRIAEYGGGAATGTVCYTEDALPEEYHNDLFLADFGKRNVLHVRVVRDGATFKAVSRENFFRNPPNTFWPVGLAVSPDGMGLYVTDWVHYDRKDIVVGRLFKATYTGKSAATPKPAWYVSAAMGRIFDASIDDLLGALSHPSREVRLVAQRRLAERGAVGPLTDVVADPKAPRRARWHAIWALDAIGAGREAILQALTDADVTVRRQAVRQLGERRVKEAAERLVPLLKDPDATIRFHAATALGRLGAGEVEPLLAALEDKDLFARFAAFTALNRLGRRNPENWASIAAALRRAQPAVREGALFALRDTVDPTVAVELSRAARSPRTPSQTRAGALEALALVCRKEPPWKGEWWTGYPGVSPYHPAKSPRPARTVDWEGTPVALETLRACVEEPDAAVRQAAVVGLADVRDAEAAAGLRKRYAREANLNVRIAIVQALGIFKDASARDLLAGVLADAEASPFLVVEAIGAAERIGGDDGRMLLLGFVRAPRGGRTALLAGIEALSRLGGAGAAEAILPILGNEDANERRGAIAALGRLRNKKAVPGLVAAFAIEETKFEAATALAKMPDVRGLDAYLYGISHVNPDLRWPASKAIAAVGKEALPLVEKRVAEGAVPGPAVAELQRVFAAAKDSPIHKARATKVDPEAYFEFALKHAGDAERGRKLFLDLKGLACSKCHRVRGEGGDLGPDLSGIGSQYARRDLAESVIYPSRKVREGYQQVIVRKKDGTILSGAVKVKTPEELTLQDGEGQRHLIRTAEIDQQKTSELSLMPDGLQAGISPQDFTDLVSYLESLKDAAKK